MRGLHRLQVNELLTLAEGFWSDGGNLYLKIGRDRSGVDVFRRWVFRFTVPGTARIRDMGLGSVHEFGADRAGLEFVRKLATKHRMLLAQGIDPIEHRRNDEAKNAAQDPIPTFDAMAKQYIIAHRAEWRHAKHGQQWESTLRDYVSPVIGRIAVNQIEVAHVQKVLEPIWHSKTETAKRVRSRIELILDHATALKYRSGDNPARWRGNLKTLLANPSKIVRVEHMPALHYRQLGHFMRELRGRKGSIAALALEFTILTCARSAETIGATWDEIDFDQSMWTVPAGRIKAEREHDVPLSKRALEILHDVRTITNGIGGNVAASRYIFPNQVTGKHMSANVLLALLQVRMKRRDISVHGFRSTFRTWCGEETNFPSDLAELALAHRVGDATERAYRRGTGFKKRIQLADAWAAFCAKPSISTDANVITLKR